jgi:hypothetical protein
MIMYLADYEPEEARIEAVRTFVGRYIGGATGHYEVRAQRYDAKTQKIGMGGWSGEGIENARLNYDGLVERPDTTFAVLVDPDGRILDWDGFLIAKATKPWYKNWKVLVPVSVGVAAVIGTSIYLAKRKGRR